MNRNFSGSLAEWDNTPVVLVGKNGSVIETICSTEVADMVEKQHNELLKDIRRYIVQLGEGKIPHTNFFIESTYINEQNKNLPCYQVTRKGCELIANKLVGTKGTLFTAKYIDRFHNMENYIKGKQGLDLSKYSIEMQAILMQDEKLQVVERRIDSLEDNIHISRSQQKQLKQFVNKIIISALGSRYSNAYKKFSSKAFSTFWRDYYNKFNVASYLDTPKCKFQEALQYINDWKPSDELRYLIIGANTYVQDKPGGQAL